MGLNDYDQAVEDLASTPAPNATPFERALRDVAREDTEAAQTRLRASVKVAADVAPDRAAEASKLGAQLGLPASFVERNFEAVKQRATLEQHDTLLRDSPALAAWLSLDPQNAKIAADDHAALGSMERLVGIGRNVAGAAGAGLVDFAQGAYGAVQAGAELVGADDLAAESAGKAQAAGRLADRLRGPQDGAGFVEHGIYGGIESVGQMAPALITGAISGSVRLLTMVGLTTGGQTYSQAREQGQTVGKSLAAGTIQGAIEVATEFIPAKLLLGDLAAKSGLLKTLAHQIASEIPTEEVATVFQDLNEWAFLPANKDKTFADYLRERPSAAAATAISTITAVGATTVAAHGTQRFIERLGAAAQESKTVERSPETAQAYVDHAAKDSGAETIYAPIDTFTTYFQQQGLDPRVMATQLTGKPGAYDTAIATGEDLAIPLGAYTSQIATDPGHNAFFAKEVRLKPEQMNVRESEAFAQELAQQATVKDGSDYSESIPASASPVRENVTQQLVSAGFTPQTADAYATLYEQAFATLGQRAGVDPVDLFTRYGLTISREGLDSAQQAAQTPSSALPAVPEETAAAGAVGTDDTRTTAGSETLGEAGRPAAIRRVDASLAPGKRESGRALDQRRSEHYADVFGAVLDAARSVDPAVDEPSLRAEFDQRLAAVEELERDYQESGHNPRRLLEAIAGYGGLSLKAERGGYSGELKWLRESPALGAFGAYAGVRGVFQDRSVNAEGQAQAGLSLDDMARMLSQDAEFGIDDIDGLLAALDDISRLGDVGRKGAVNFPGTPELRKRAGIHMERAWWKPAAEQEYNQGPNDPTLFDTLDTGEQQPRLPGAEDVRDQNIATPQLDAPFALTSETAKPSKVKQTTLFQAFFHGSPHDFSRFSLDHIGTGEGNQAYGYGLYFAENPKVAEGYARQKLTGPENVAYVLREHSRDYVERRLSGIFPEMSDAQIADAIANAKAPGRFYQVEIPDEQVAKMLDWDAPLSEQSDYVKQALGFSVGGRTVEEIQADTDALTAEASAAGLSYTAEREPFASRMEALGREYYAAVDHAAPSHITGGQFYRGDDGSMGGAAVLLHQAADQESTSKALLAQGIPGIKYFDAGSRSGKDGTRNIVVFDDSIVKLTHKDGTPVTEQERKEYFQGPEDYGGEHRPPGPGDGAPANDLTGGGNIYPDDVYGWNAARYYGTGEDRMDAVSFSIVHALKGRPNAPVTIYRAIPNDLSVADKIQKIEGEKRYILKHGKVPPTADTRLGSNAYYNQIHDELERLKALPPEEARAKPTINAGDWVTINRSYAKEHGEGALRGAYRIISKKVKASEIFTNGDSIHEWGYWPGGVQSKEYQQGNRGSLSFDAERRQMAMRLFEKADLSTFLHESGHFFLEVLRDLEGQSPDIAKDMATLREWFKADDIGTEQHEQFARGFEAYLMEGTAPSTALRGVFARFRSWLTGVYRSLRGLNVTLTPEVRRVFDRLLASDEAIAQSEQEAELVPLFIDAASSGMAPEAFEAYRGTVEKASTEARQQLADRVLKDLQREQQAWWTTEKDKTRTTVAAEFGAQPIYQAWFAIQRGTNPDGTNLDGLPDPLPLKLDKAALASRYTAEELGVLRRRQLYTVEGGMSPDAAADIFGFTSGDELVQGLLTATPFKAAVEAETEQRMRDQHGDILLDQGALHEAAQAAVFEQREKVVQAELRALTAGVVKGTIPPAAVLNAAAADRIARMHVRELSPGRFLMAARRASRQAFELLATNEDRVGAVKAKQQELLNLALYREATQAKDEAQAFATHMRDTQRGTYRQRIGKAGSGYLDQIDGIADRYEFATVSQKVLDRRASLRAWAAAQEAEGLPVDLPESLLEDANRRNWREVSVDELRGIRDAVKQIEHLARLKNRLLTAANKRAFDDAVGDIVTSIDTHNDRKPLPLEFTPKDEKARKAAKWFASHTKLSTFIHALDGYKDGGPLWEYVMRPINDAATREADLKGEAAEAFHALFRESYSGREAAKLSDQLFIPAINASLSKEARIAIALNWGNEGNRQRVRDGRQWTNEQVQAILDTLDARDVAFVNGVWTFINGFWPEIAAKQQRVVGVAPEKVEASGFVARGGTFTGGYYPLIYDGRLSARASSIVEGNEANLQKQAAYVKATTRRGHTEARAANVKQPVRLDLSVIGQHVEQVIHDLTHHEMLIDVGRLLGDRRVQQAIYETRGDITYQQIKDALKDIAYGAQRAGNMVEHALNSARAKVVIAGLGWNLWTSVQQPAGIFNGMERVGAKWVMRGMVHSFRDTESTEATMAWIYERSDMMRLRGMTQQREIAEIRSTLIRQDSWFDHALRTTTFNTLNREDIEGSFFKFIEVAQRLADVPTWRGAYEKARASGETDDRAVALADQAVLDTQGGGQIKDLAQVQRGGPVLKLFTTFYSYGNLLYNQTADSYGRTNFKKAKSVGEFVVSLSLIYVWPAFASVMLAQAFGRGDDDESWFTAMGREVLGQAMNTMLLVREFGGLARAVNRGYEGPTGARFISMGYRLGQQAAQGDLDSGLWRASTDVAGLVFGFPAAQLQRTADGFMALRDGTTKNPLALATGAPRGAR